MLTVTEISQAHSALVSVRAISLVLKQSLSSAKKGTSESVLITANTLESAFPLWRITKSCINNCSHKAEQACSLSLDLMLGVFFGSVIRPKSLMLNQSS